jgi:hypothetical protein
MTSWNEFHSDPRKSYYLSLRQGYRCSAREAHAKVKRTDAMVVGLQRRPYETNAVVSVAAVVRLLGCITAARRYAVGSMRTLFVRPSSVPPAAERWLASRFSHIT